MIEIKKLEKIIKKYEKTLAFFVAMGYNISCLVQEDILLDNICAISSVGRAPDS